MKEYSDTFSYGKKVIPFSVTFSNRRTMEISVHPDERVVVMAPTGTETDKIIQRLKKRARWIKMQINYFHQFTPHTPPRRYVGGESHLYLGRQYRLKIRKRKDEGVKLKGGYFYVTTPDHKNPVTVETLLKQWYKDHAISTFNKRLQKCFEAARSLKVKYPEVKLRKMSKRWGSCTKAGNILLNSELIKAPVYCIDYVIMHELCHLKDHTHSNRYYKLLSKYMPDWERRKERLEKAVT